MNRGSYFQQNLALLVVTILSSGTKMYHGTEYNHIQPGLNFHVKLKEREGKKNKKQS